MQEAFGGGLSGSDDSEAERAIQLGGGGNEALKKRVDPVQEVRRVDDPLRGCDFGRAELGRESRRTAGGDDEIPGESGDGFASLETSRNDAEDLDIRSFAVLVWPESVDCDYFFAESDVAALLTDLAGDLVRAPQEVVGKLSSGGIECRQRDERNEARGLEGGEVGEEGVAGLRVPESREVLQEAVRRDSSGQSRVSEAFSHSTDASLPKG